MHSSLNYRVISFYKFIDLNNLEQLKINFNGFLKKNDFKGTVLIAREGINGTLSCEKSKIVILKNFLKKNFKSNLSYKIHHYKSHVFLRLKIKIKNEIIKLGKKNLKPRLQSGKYVKPDQWNKLIKKDNVVTLDTRNHYESEIGTFKNSVETKLSNFTEFPEWFEKNKKFFENKEIAMFCTGGIRCEKASSYLLKLGYNKIHQLDGGIINYLKKTKNEEKEWQGECFVFDERVSINENLNKGKYFQCFACRSAISDVEKKSKNYKKGVYCPKCKKKTSKTQKKRFNERNKQIKIAKSKGIRHLGS